MTKEVAVRAAQIIVAYLNGTRGIEFGDIDEETAIEIIDEIAKIIQKAGHP